MCHPKKNHVTYLSTSTLYISHRWLRRARWVGPVVLVDRVVLLVRVVLVSINVHLNFRICFVSINKRKLQILVCCVMFLVWFVLVLVSGVVCPMLSVSLDCPFLYLWIVHSCISGLSILDSYCGFHQRLCNNAMVVVPVLKCLYQARKMNSQI